MMADTNSIKDGRLNRGWKSDLIGILEDEDGILAGGCSAAGGRVVPHELAQRQIVVNLGLRHLGIIYVDLGIVRQQSLAHINCRRFPGVTRVLHMQIFIYTCQIRTCSAACAMMLCVAHAPAMLNRDQGIVHLLRADGCNHFP